MRRAVVGAVLSLLAGCGCASKQVKTDEPSAKNATDAAPPKAVTEEDGETHETGAPGPPQKAGQPGRCGLGNCQSTAYLVMPLPVEVDNGVTVSVCQNSDCSEVLVRGKELKQSRTIRGAGRIFTVSLRPHPCSSGAFEQDCERATLGRYLDGLKRGLDVMIVSYHFARVGDGGSPLSVRVTNSEGGVLLTREINLGAAAHGERWDCFRPSDCPPTCCHTLLPIGLE